MMPPSGAGGNRVNHACAVPPPAPAPIIRAMDHGLESLSLRAYGASPGSHVHDDHAQVLLGLHGALALEVDGRGHLVGPGQGLLVPAGARHDFEAARGARCLVLDSRHPGWRDLGPLHAPPAAAHGLARYLAEALAAGLPRAQVWGPALVQELFQPPARVQHAQRAIDWIALGAWALARTDRSTGVAELAARVHLSGSQLAARCRAELGQPLMHWLRGLRLDEARRLRGQGLAVAEVARRCGYRSPSALTAALRRTGR